MFSAGCLIYYVVTGGKHPFGDQKNIEDYNVKLNEISQGQYT